jgi:hypothetical protein
MSYNMYAVDKGHDLTTLVVKPSMKESWRLSLPLRSGLGV